MHSVRPCSRILARRLGALYPLHGGEHDHLAPALVRLFFLKTPVATRERAFQVSRGSEGSHRLHRLYVASHAAVLVNSSRHMLV